MLDTPHHGLHLAPNFSMFGREPRLPVDLAFGLGINNEEYPSMPKYIKSLREKLKTSYELVSKTALEAQKKQKTQYDTRVRGATIEVGDRVLVKIVAFDGKHKLADRWEEDIYVVLRQPNQEIPVFVVQREDGQGKKRTLHRNLLLPIGSIPMQEPEVRPVPTARERPKPAPRRKVTTRPGQIVEIAEHHDLQNEDEAVLYVALPKPEEAISSVLLDTSSEASSVVLVVSEEAGDGFHPPLETQSPEPSEDAHSSATDDEQDSGSGQESDEEPVVSDAHTEEEVVGDESHLEESAHVDSETDEDENEPLAAGGHETAAASLPRRTERIRRKPLWQESGEWVMSQTSSTPDWERKTEYLKKCLASEEVRKMSPQAYETFVSVIMAAFKT